jgi:Lrp/AsnC family leucine-responsive transcriptional regulator
MLYQDSQISQSELANHLKISQPAVSARMHKLEKEGVLTRMIGTDIKKTILFLAKLDISTDNVEGVLSFLDKCPMYLNSFLTSGRFNMTILLIGENIRSIMSCVDSHFRKSVPIKDLQFDLIVAPARSFIVPIKPIIDKKRINLCDTDCGNCTFYISDRCLGCPAYLNYKGNLL